MEMNDLKDALIHELKDLFSAETQIAKALPKMARNAHADELKAAFREHLQETEDHIERIRQALEFLKQKTGRQKCKGMEGILAEGEDLLKKKATDEVRDALIIGAAQKVEHYEIASYGAAAAWGDVLGINEVSDLLHETLKEEERTDRKLSEIAISVNRKPEHAF